MTFRMIPPSQTYTQILKSTMLMGGSSLVNVALSIVRNKAMAVLLGPEGIGLMGLYSSIVDMAQSLAGLGVGGSGVRQVAEAAGTGDTTRIAQSATVLRRISVVLALFGALLLAALAYPVSSFTFGDYQHVGGIVLLSLAVFFRLVSAGQGALIQGMRGIADLARINVLAGLFGTAVSIPLIYLFGVQAIAPSLVLIAAASIVPTWWYSRRIFPNPYPMSARQFGRQVSALLRLGFVFMASGLLTFGAAYAIRIIVLKEGGVMAAGLYQAAWGLGGLYAGFILQAMGTDFYPRLTAMIDNDVECNRLVNEQAEASMLLAAPGLLGTLTLAPLMMSLFYSAEFHGAVELLRWICLGMMLRIISWPMGFIVVAKNTQAIFFWTEVAAAVVHVGLAWLLVSLLGTQGAGMAFFGLYVWHGILIYVIVRKLTGFRWSAANRRHALLFLPASGLVFLMFSILPLWPATVIGFVAVLVCGLYSLRMLVDLLPPESVPAMIRGWITKSA
ncbi:MULTISPECIES: O-antigen translocase [Rhizobium]|uniref:O-antigen translocase n=1 Tax=Rhizobium TaxID=379 RepID=UPI0007EA2BE6|nr:MULTISPECIES: O-antigen translocase [Rhizobium]ANK85041.1 polysaccharide biosynthesis protein [Rhizobium sp. N731]ANK90922.1 polysaccharide biosynthesis protein [Rhizobium sp. N6212]ANK96951.1 polysaccharide biosynthesis protein [Rhizobium sp. N621]ANL03071.1 polysaccharide biosynthesis protein [Rhizobium esperanzae]ANL09120.1 polysaccharide biosynthesis protein [Rhizobium sp. N1341]